MTALDASQRCCAARMSGLFSMASRTRLLSSRRGSASSSSAPAGAPTGQFPSRANPSTQPTHRLRIREGFIETPHGSLLSSDPLSAMMGTTMCTLSWPLIPVGHRHQDKGSGLWNRAFQLPLPAGERRRNIHRTPTLCLVDVIRMFASLLQAWANIMPSPHTYEPGEDPAASPCRSWSYHSFLPMAVCMTREP